MEVRLTHFEHRGIALGVAMSHGVVDAKGLHLIVGELAQCYRSGGTNLIDSSRCLETGKDCWWTATGKKYLDETYETDEKGSIDITGVKRELLFWFLRHITAPSMHARNSRASVLFRNEKTKFNTASAIQKVVGNLPSHLYLTRNVQLCATVDVRRTTSVPKLYTGNAVYFAREKMTVSEVGTTFARLAQNQATAC